jgi:DNA-directed RNA polymerase subunit F
LFAFSLAKELGMTVKQLMRDMDAIEFMEWAAYFKAIDPEESKKIKDEIKSDEQRAAELRVFFSLIRGK